jgi:single-strand DNA-binding protein
MVLAQLFAMLKDAGLQEEAMQHFMEKVLRMDVEDAKIYAKDIAEAAKKAQQEQQGGFGGDGGGFDGGGGGGFGGGSDGGQKGDAYGEQQ